MKHTKEVTILIITLFLLTQLIGLGIISKYIKIEKSLEDKIVYKDGKPVVEKVIVEKKSWYDLPYKIKRPEFEKKTSYLEIVLAILIATILAMLLIKYQATTLWKLWFFLSVWFCLLIAFNSVFKQQLAIIFGLILAGIKILKKDVFFHNLTELFIYGGLAVVFVPILNMISISILLILISIYDFIAVRKTKHMIKLAKFQTRIKLFAGLLIPYAKNKTAILGGGDMGFPLLFTGVIFKQQGWISLIIPLTTAIALALLLFKSKKNKYYPAMPFLTAGCFAGYFLILILNLV